jgi:hypothetical protein
MRSTSWRSTRGSVLGCDDAEPSRRLDLALLRQHADDPVDGREWGEEAFAEARERDVPVSSPSAPRPATGVV